MSPFLSSDSRARTTTAPGPSHGAHASMPADHYFRDTVSATQSDCACDPPRTVHGGRKRGRVLAAQRVSDRQAGSAAVAGAERVGRARGSRGLYGGPQAGRARARFGSPSRFGTAVMGGKLRRQISRAAHACKSSLRLRQLAFCAAWTTRQRERRGVVDRGIRRRGLECAEALFPPLVPPPQPPGAKRPWLTRGEGRSYGG